MSNSFWVFSVTPENCEITRKNQIWAVRTQNLAKKVKKGDFIVLYVVGMGSFLNILQIAEDWKVVERATWADEVSEGRIKYPYQAKISLIADGQANVKELLEKLTFIKNKQKWGIYFQGTPANLGNPISESDYQLIHDTMKRKPLPADVTSLIKTEPKIAVTQKLEHGQGVSSVPRHNEIRDMIFDIGKIEGKIAEVEYPIDNLRLDVVWKTITAGNPKWAFEVQMAGNFYEALTKLKHAWDKWNSKPFLVTTEVYAAQAKSLLEGSFHEMRDDARIVNWEKILRLHKLLKEAHEIKSEIRF